MSQDIRLEVWRMRQANAVVYVGALRASEILRICSVDAYDPNERPGGYQRPRDPSRCRQFANYVKEEVGLAPNAVLLNLRDRWQFTFTPVEGDRGILQIADDATSAWVVDGQHRLGGFEMLLKEADPHAETPIPVVFVEGLDRTQEAALFLTVNSKQKNISPSLKYFDLMRSEDQRLQSWLEGRSGELKVKAAALVTRLCDDKESSWHQLVNLGGLRRLRRPINLVSFVTALVPVLADAEYAALSEERQYLLLKNFWNAVRHIWREDWPPPAQRLVPIDDLLLEEETGSPPSSEPEWWHEWEHRQRRATLLQKTMGVYALSLVALDIFRFCRLLNGVAPESEDGTRGLMLEYVAALRRHLDNRGGWGPDSELATYGGMKAYRALAFELRDTLVAYHKDRHPDQPTHQGGSLP
jgi:DNA sulfur modification protein DndB